MNKKGMSVGFIVISFIGIIVALAILGSIGDTTGDMINIRTTVNESITTAAINETVTLFGRENTTAIIVSNNTAAFSSSFEVVTKNAGGSLAILLKTRDGAASDGSNLSAMNVSYSYKPQGYNDSSGARGIVNIILIFAAITIMAFAYGPVREALAEIGIGK